MLPFLDKILNRNNEPVEYFLTLEIKEEIVKAAVWKTVNGKTIILGTGEAETSDKWDEIIKNSDIAITTASHNLPEEKIEKTIFGLPTYWIVDGKIKDGILTSLKKLCSDLSLKPLGFVIITEALVEEMQKKDGTPLTAILVEVGIKRSLLSVVRIGKISSSTVIEGDSINLTEHMVEVLKSLPDKEILPSRIILYDEKKDLEKIKDDIISYPWTQKAAFLHFPKVDILTREFDIDGIIDASSKEIKNRFSVETETKTTQVLEETGKTEEAISSDEPVFVEDRDVLEEKVQQPAVKEEITPQPEPVVENIPQPQTAVESIPQPQIIRQPVYQNVEPVMPEVPIKEKRQLAKPDISHFIKSFLGIFSFIKIGKSSLIIVPIILVLIFGSAVFAYFQFASAKIKIYIEPQILEKETEILVSEDEKAVQKDSNIIKAASLEVDEEGSQKSKTTGEKTIGEKAKGEVTLYNKTTTGAKTFKSGTILIGPDDKQFTLDSDTTIPVATSQTEGITFGKTTAKITASDIGSDFNLSAGKKEFSVKEYSNTSYSASSDIAFTGGSSKKIKIVAEIDKTKLTAALTGSLETKAKKDLKSKLSQGQVLIDESVEKTSEKNTFSPETGEEGTELTLNSQTKFKALVYDQKDIQFVLDGIVAKKTTGDFEYNKGDITMSVKSIDKTTDKNDNNLTSLKVVFKVKLLPKINKDTIRKDISGKNTDFVKEYIAKLPSAKGFEADASPRFPDPFFVFPRNLKNITIEIIPKE